MQFITSLSWLQVSGRQHKQGYPGILPAAYPHNTVVTLLPCVVVLDRVDFSGLSDVRDTEVAVDPLTLLPSKSDVAILKKQMSTIFSQ